MHQNAALPNTRGKINGCKGQTYQNLDALVYSAVNDLIDPIYQDDPELVAIIRRNLLADKYFPLINANTDKATEQLVADLVIGQNAPAVYPRYLCLAYRQATILTTRLDNLSIYYQEGAMRRTIVDLPYFPSTSRCY